MLIKQSQLLDYLVEASDGEVGRIDDLYFRQGEWLIRYMLLHAAFEPPDRRVLVSLYNVNEILHEKKAVSIDLTSQQIRNSPDTDIARPISPQHEAELNRYYGWPPDWLQEEHDITPIGPLSGRDENTTLPDDDEFSRPLLQSCREILDTFRIQVDNTEIGKVTDFVIDDQRWHIFYLAAEFADSPTGQVLLAADRVERVDWTDSHIYLDASLDTLRETPEYGPSRPLDDKLEENLRSFYGLQ